MSNLTLRIKSVTDNILSHSPGPNSGFDTAGCGHTITFKYYAVVDGNVAVTEKTSFDAADKAFLKNLQIHFRYVDGVDSTTNFYPSALDSAGDVVLTYVNKGLKPGTQLIYGAALGNEDIQFMVDGEKEIQYTVKTIPGSPELTTLAEITSATSVKFTHTIPDGEARGFGALPSISYSYSKDKDPLAITSVLASSDLVKSFSSLESVPYTFKIKFTNTIGDFEKVVKVTPTDVPTTITVAELSLKSNLELAADKSKVDGGVTVFYKLPSNAPTLVTLGAPITAAVIKLDFMKLNKSTPSTYTVVDRSITIEVSDLNKNSTNTAFDMQYTFTNAQVTVGESVRASVAFKNKNSNTLEYFSVTSSLAMSMKLAENATILYHVIPDASSCAIEFYRNAEPNLFGASAPANPAEGYRIYTKKDTAGESSTSFSFSEIFEDDKGVFVGRNSSGDFIGLNDEGTRTETTSNVGVRTASSVSAVVNGIPTLLSGVVRLYKSSMSAPTPGSAYTIRVCTVSKSPHSNDVFESTGISQIIYAKQNVGQVGAITGSSVDVNGIPLKNGSSPAVNISFPLPTNNLALNGGVKGAVSFVLRDQLGKSIDGANALSYPTDSTTAALSWTVSQPLGQQCNYQVLVQVMDEQKTKKENAKLPTVVPMEATLGAVKLLLDQRSIDYLPAVTDLKFTRNSSTSMNFSWIKQVLPSTQTYLLTDFVNVLVVLDDATGSIVNSAVEVSFANLSQNFTGLTVGRKYSAHMIPRQKFGLFDKIMKNVASISFVAGASPSAPSNVVSYPSEKSIVLDWDNSTANGGTLSNYEIAAIRNVPASNVTTPAFPSKQNMVMGVTVSYATLIKAYLTPESGVLGGQTTTDINDIINRNTYKAAVRSTSVLSSKVDPVQFIYESLTLKGSSVNDETLVSAWSDVVDATPDSKPEMPGAVTVLSDTVNVNVSWDAVNNQEFIVFNNNDLYFKSSVHASANGDDSGVSRLQNAEVTNTKYSFSDAKHTIKCGSSTKDLKIFNVSVGGVLSEARIVANLSAMVSPGQVTEAAFEVVDATTCKVSFKAPSNAGAAGQTIFTANGAILNGPLMYEITVESPESTTKKTFKVSTLSAMLDGITDGSSIFIGIKTYYMQNTTTVADSSKVYVNRLNGFSLKQAIRLGPSPLAGSISNVLATTSTANQISFDYRFPAAVTGFVYPIKELQVLVDGAVVSTITTGSFAYDSSRNITVLDLKYGKSYKVQVQSIGDYLNAQNAPSTEIAIVVPYAKMEFSNIAKSGDTYTCDVNLNGDVITNITAISKPSESSKPLVISTPLPSTIKFSGAETGALAANQSARFEFTSANSSAALVIVSGKTFDIRDHPASSFGALIPV